MPKKPVITESYRFESKAETEKKLREILYSVDFLEKVPQEHLQLFCEIFALHPEYPAKLAGREISHFEVHPNKGGSRCFHACFTNGENVHFSFKKCP